MLMLRPVATPSDGVGELGRRGAAASGRPSASAIRGPRPGERGARLRLPRPCSSTSAVERSIAVGLARPVPAMSGAKPCTGSKMPGPPSPRLADAADPSPPVTAAATSERMSPKVFSVTMTSKLSGWVTMLHGDRVDEPWSSSTSG